MSKGNFVILLKRLNCMLFSNNCGHIENVFNFGCVSAAEIDITCWDTDPVGDEDDD